MLFLFEFGLLVGAFIAGTGAGVAAVVAFVAAGVFVFALLLIVGGVAGLVSVSSAL